MCPIPSGYPVSAGDSWPSLAAQSPSDQLCHVPTDVQTSSVQRQLGWGRVISTSSVGSLMHPEPAPVCKELNQTQPSSPYSWINEWNCAEIEYVLNRVISWVGKILTGAFPLRYNYLANSTFPRIKGGNKKMLFSPTPSWPRMLRTTSSHLNFFTNSPFICRYWDAILRSG